MPNGHLPVVSYLAVPVISRSGEVIGGLFFGHDQAGVFTQDTEEMAVAIAAHAAVAIDNARLYATTQEEMRSKELLLNEFKHRVKNTLATVLAVAGQTLRKSDREEREAFGARLHALAHAHDALTEREWDRASISELVQRTLAPFAKERFAIDGPDASIAGNGALHLTMALHELATNAAKYGALSNQDGKVSAADANSARPGTRPRAAKAGALPTTTSPPSPPILSDAGSRDPAASPPSAHRTAASSSPTCSPAIRWED